MTNSPFKSDASPSLYKVPGEVKKKIKEGKGKTEIKKKDVEVEKPEIEEIEKPETEKPEVSPGSPAQSPRP